MKFMESIETTLNENRNKIGSIIPFDGKFVPVPVSKTVSSYLPVLQDGKPVPCLTVNFEIIRFQKRKRTVKEVSEEKAQTTIARCKRAISIINKGNMLPNRPGGDSRVYCDLTNLNREFRRSIEIDGRKIVGVDIANSQPLIASILLRQYWLNKTGGLPDDVKQYQSDCEAGEFYQNFMAAINLPDELKSQFKEDFFRKVFFSKVIEKSNVLKDMFIAKYPSCWEAICDEKGGLYSTEYNEFAKKLQRVEASIIFDFVNIGLIKRGIKAFNIFDSIYVNNRTDLDTAIQLMEEGFITAGVNPKIKPEYEEHLDENEHMPAIQLQYRLAYEQKIKKQEMKKRYTVDELISSKKKTDDTTPKIERQSKLQHLKIGDKESKLMQANKLFQSIQQQDAEDEKIQNMVPKTNKEIYDFVVQELKRDGHKVNKENIDYLTEVVKSTLVNPDSEEDVPMPGYKFVNPYVKKSV